MKESPAEVLYKDDRIACTHFALDLKRPHKRWGLDLVGKHIRPVITPDDPARVKAIIEQHLAG
jgi:hypothetical protein